VGRDLMPSILDFVMVVGFVVFVVLALLIGWTRR
jgi:hypothetical protein